MEKSEIQDYRGGSFVDLQKRDEIQQQARLDAQRNLPDSYAKEPRGAETEIKNYFRNYLNSVRKGYEVKLRGENSIRMKVQLDHEHHSRTIVRQAEIDVVRIKEREKESLKDLIRKRDIAQSDLWAFQDAHKVTHRAVYPENHWPVVTLLFSMLLGESILNANMLAKTNVYGIIGGWTEAIFISLANILSGLFSGWGPFRYCRHKVRNWKIAGKAVAGLYVAFVLLFNFIFAHYRMATEATATGKVIKKGVESALADPFAIFSDIQTFSLFVVGVLCSVAAAWKGHGLDDSYPGYGKVYRAWEYAKQNYIEAQKAIRDEIDKVFMLAKNKASEVVPRANNDVSRVTTSLTNSSSLQKEFVNRAQSIESECSQCVSIYRKTNRNVRTTGPPAYFSDPVNFTADLFVLRDDTEKDELKLNDFVSTLDDLQDSVNDRIDDLNNFEEKTIVAMDSFFGDLESEIHPFAQKDDHGCGSDTSEATVPA